MLCLTGLHQHTAVVLFVAAASCARCGVPAPHTSAPAAAPASRTSAPAAAEESLDGALLDGTLRIQVESPRADLLDCAGSHVGELAPGGNTLLRACDPAPLAAFGVGGLRWSVGVQVSSWDHEGMYGYREDVVFARPAGRLWSVLGRMVQYEESVYPVTRVVERRLLAKDLEGDGRTELCVEEVRDVGLAPTSEAIDRRELWQPRARVRRVRAWRARSMAQGPSLERAATLDSSCPAIGYRALAVTSVAYGVYEIDPVYRRRGGLGPAPLHECTAGQARDGDDDDARWCRCALRDEDCSLELTEM